MWWKKKRIYMDYAAATPVCDSARRAYSGAVQSVGNSGAIHKEGTVARAILEDARVFIARFLGCRAREIIFTSGGTESNNIAIIGFANVLEKEGTALGATHWIVSSIEHPSVLACFDELERRGANVTRISPDVHGIITPKALQRALQKNTVFVSIGWVNGEIGTVQPMRGLAKVIRAHSVSIAFHSDAGQAPLYRTTTVHGLGVDMLTIDSGKCYGPKGVGAIYVAHGTSLAPVMFGGGQERGIRPGSESHALAAGFAAALAWVRDVREGEVGRLQQIRDMFIQDIKTKIPDVVVNGHQRNVAPHIVNISLPDIDSEYFALSLDYKGIAISTKSSCREGEEKESHVVRALGGEAWTSQNTLRFSFGSNTSKRDVSIVIKALLNAAQMQQGAN